MEKIRTSITVDWGLLKRIDHLVKTRRFANRSHFFERAAFELLEYEELLMEAGSPEEKQKFEENMKRLAELRKKVIGRMG